MTECSTKRRQSSTVVQLLKNWRS